MSNRSSNLNREESGNINNSENIKPAIIIIVTRGTNCRVTYGETQNNENRKHGKQ